MRCQAVRMAIVATVMLGGPSLADASVEKAQLLYDAMFLDDAKRELIETISSTADDEEKAAALHLLGTIAVDEKRYDTAIRTWTDLTVKYPNSPHASEVKAKLPMVKKLEQQAAELATVESSMSSTTGRSRGVMVVGGGAETRYLEQAVDEISAFLIGQQVQASKPVNWRAPLSELVTTTRQDTSASILILNIKFGYLESLRAECYRHDGKLEWEEKASGSFGFTSSGVAAGLIKRMKSKLEERIGDACLPRPQIQ